ncbi:glycosyl hydrolase family 79 C-terminal domain-containing protein [Aspergillus saccharolyticus JOP 1030-1]|uniref:Beta-glucuronidase C-terminal domain-containing protein n=1 Tax=Aspergillus saccharolyticus JOP 1030-1 TaxID=1450539 RepID=A0A318ZN69_9EURO|nr:hypothetical protein BP01DRAFT_201190 [Aspergillus saccharolyticus JOP 1030-1]PYH47944.1 hypothetical protein BP01DRAFT_201190 [Aspergillus saccharolyticus JOP 1030-1]
MIILHNRRIITAAALAALSHITSTTAAPTTATITSASNNTSAVVVSPSVPESAGLPVLHPFVSFSIEFVFFPDYAGNRTHPNTFSNQLLDNLAELEGVKPYIRVGGNTQDFALYDPTLAVATNGTYVPSISTDYPLLLTIGPSFFESYGTWPGAKFIHGFNLGRNTSAQFAQLLETVPLVCRALEGGRLAFWELGNEPDLYKTSAQGAVRPPTWTEQDYVNEWTNKTSAIRKKMRESCSTEFAEAKYIAPSFAGVSNSLNPVVTWENGLDRKRNIALNSEHNYIGGATQPGVTLQKTLMNHTVTVQSVAQHVNVSTILQQKNLTTDIPYILGETNSLYNEGAAGLSNSFGAALWGVDFNLYCASQNIRRTHMHQGLNYRYISWQPVDTNRTTIGTKAPYYGNVMVAAMLHGGEGGEQDDVQIANLPLERDTEAAYAAYVNGALARIAVINLVEFNYTDQVSSQRPNASYVFQVPSASPGTTVSVQRLTANGSNAITGITWDGWSYNYELENGKPVRLPNTTTEETVQVSKDGTVSIDVPWSSAALLKW